MHELSIANSIVETVTSELTGETGRIKAIQIDVGVLSGVVPEALMFAWEAACQGSRLAGSRLEIHSIPAAVQCPGCDAERTLSSPDRLRCPVCNAFVPDLISGQELRIRGVELGPPA